MNRSLLKRLGLIAVILVTIQLTTYMTLSKSMLREELLPEHMILGHNSDTAWVCNSMIGMCGTGPESYDFHDDSALEDLVKQKLKVRHVSFINTSDELKGDHPHTLLYRTLISNSHFLNVNHWFSVVQTEEVTPPDRRQTLSRRVHYRWILFTWLKTFEYIKNTSPAEIASGE